MPRLSRDSRGHLARAVTLAGVILALSSGCAVAPGYGQSATSSLGTGQAFRGDDVDNFNVGDRQTLYVSTRQGFVFRLDASQRCFPVGTDSVSVARLGGGDPRITIGEQVIVTIRQGRDVPVNCLATVAGPIVDSRVSGLRSRTLGT